ncbi:DUF805 domain-containing protein [Rhodopseudomonas sp.]|uniref:DUF805 domain-containing protein n=1 Tax=Rhodopseudomonas sp. TaxID=1078 RepID=UPI003B3AD589
MDWTTLLFSFKGRINRAKYWLVSLLNVAAWMVFGSIALIWLGGLDSDNLFRFAGGALLIWAVAIALSIAGTWAFLATGIKRLHDRDKSGWWIVLFWFGPGLGGGSGTAMGDSSANLALSLIGFGIAVWGFVELGCLRGTRGPNQYGPDPLEPQGAVI